MVTPPRGDVRRCRASGRYGSCCCGYIFYILATLATYGNAAVFAPRTKWELHEAVARCLGGCMAWHQNRTDSSKCLAWGNQTAAAACRLLASADVSRVTCFADLFSDATGFNQDLSTWNVNSATDMQRMFHGTRAFRQSLCSPAWLAAMENGMVIKTGMFGGGSAGGIYCCPRGDYYVAVTRRAIAARGRDRNQSGGVQGLRGGNLLHVRGGPDLAHSMLEMWGRAVLGRGPWAVPGSRRRGSVLRGVQAVRSRFLLSGREGSDVGPRLPCL